MGEENVYFDDEEYLVTSCRFLIREEGKTILIKDLSDPLLVETGIDSHKSYPLFDTLGPLGLLVDVVVNELKADSRNKWGEFRVVATLKGKNETLVAEKFFPRDAFANPESECW